jgi:ABC-2 type transport system ATP-binding protein
MQMPIALEAQGLEKNYPAGVRALDGLTFEAEAGTVFGLVGPNGAGKSTAVKILTTLTRPDRGRARVAGIDVLAKPAQVRRAIGCVAQRSGAIRDLTGRENLRLQGQLFGMDRRGLARQVDELLSTFGLAEAGDRLVRTYSGGMQRRLDIAVALVHQPQVLFLDEPTTGLDPEVRADMWDVLSDLAAAQGLTILLTTHYLEEADQFVSRLAIVDRGRVVAQGSPDELKGQLHGDAIQIELGPSANGRARRVLDKMDGVRDVTVDGSLLRARVGRGATALPAVLSALDAEQIPVASVAVARPSLDDVYLHYAGRAFRQAEEVTSR